ncbi:MAG: polyribonucleotide nucleotidyltransferase [Actinomycetota bacterium]|nr:polyribonucleotide nucleotidyltransferase [Actinomycetota bacterium]
MAEIHKKTFEVDGKAYSFETGKLAKQADGAVMVRLGDTMVLVTTVSSKQPRENADFLPLTIDVDEKMYAAGKIPGSFFKREGRPSESATLTARLIDRPLRPKFPKGFFFETQVIATVMSVDLMNLHDVLALNGASMALLLAGTPFAGPVSGVRVGRVEGRWIINPTYQELDESDMDLVLAGSDEAILMVEADARQVAEADILKGLSVGHDAIRQFNEAQRQFKAEAGKEGWTFEPPAVDVALQTKVRDLGLPAISAATKNPDKLAREGAVSEAKSQVVAALLEEYPDQERTIKDMLKAIEKELVRAMIIDEGVRVDGRGLDEIRPLDVEVAVLPRTHGTGLFTRGQTQALSVVTLGTLREDQIIDGIGVETSRHFMHHYNFPPFCTGEARRMIGPKRRDIGHGALGERAVLQVLPDEEEFPYTIRIVSEVLESNGSSSMASICGSSLALMDAGVPITAAVAGIAMGLVKEGEKVAVLTDIQGLEDFLGDMDFKVAGTRAGITALQMDMKVAGVSEEIFIRALEQARQARLFILDKMDSVIKEPREEMSPYAPRIITIKIPTEKIREVIGPGGRVVQGIIAETGATIDIEDDGTIYVASKDGVSGAAAQQMIEAIVKDVEPGQVYTGRVTKVMPFGAFVEIKPGREGLVHISKLANRRIERVEDVVNEGDTLRVRVLEIDRQNRVSLTAVDVEESSN